MKRRESYPLCFVIICLFLVIGCRQESPPVMFGRNYGAVLVGSYPFLHQSGNLRLYHFRSYGRRELIWPYLTMTDPVTMGDLIVFNGGASDGKPRGYPATFAYAGTGTVVELTKPLITRLDPQLAVHTNYAFRIVSSTNDVVEFHVLQTPPIDPSRPIPNTIEVEKTTISAMIAAAHTNGIHSKYDGVEFIIAK